MSITASIPPSTCVEAFSRHPALATRYARSRERLQQVRAAFAECESVRDGPLAIFCAGSLARMDVGAKSDLDIFVTADHSDRVDRRLFKIRLFSELMATNERLGFPPFSNDGEYLKIYFMDDLTSRAGSRFDDSENLFTTRMLLILESQFVVNEQVYRRHLRRILELYYRDQGSTQNLFTTRMLLILESQFVVNEQVYRRHLRRILELYYRDQGSTPSFRPVFLLNDLLRYWRTMCLNYEERRHDVDLPFRKKNVNLKFSRMLMVFGTVLPLIAEPIDSVAELENLCARTPLERLASGLDRLEDADLAKRWSGALDEYEDFLSWKESADVEDLLTKRKAMVNRAATTLSTFLYDALTHESIPGDLRRCLIL